ncbi:hypothetical protein [Arthrobacter glacialis]|uniref:Uncharacterized protein n=1 Tax=Arthrobacter glacialis TaxID=1664 RepID=A0A2S3ZUI0_ARTGL|nr:hypothetical protein [Arthrobacter glacialis]POH72507.1 hypothetical protein CVS27_15415 [Arthrobacter glacialis]
MTTLLRRRIAILIAITSTVLAYAIGFSTPVLNGVTLLALMVLAAGTYAAHRIQRSMPAKEAHVELTGSSAAIESSHHRQAA